MKSWSTPWPSGSSGTITAVTTTARTSAGTWTRVGSGRHWATWSTYIAAARDHGRTGLSQVKDEAEQHCNTKFDYKALYGAVLVATRDIWLGPTPTELYINYGYREENGRCGNVLQSLGPGQHMGWPITLNVHYMHCCILRIKLYRIIKACSIQVYSNNFDK